MNKAVLTAFLVLLVSPNCFSINVDSNSYNEEETFAANTTLGNKEDIFPLVPMVKEVFLPGFSEQLPPPVIVMDEEEEQEQSPVESSNDNSSSSKGDQADKEVIGRISSSMDM